MIDGRVGDKTDCRFVNPFPEGYIFVHDAGFEGIFRFEIDDLELSLIFIGNDVGRWT